MVYWNQKIALAVDLLQFVSLASLYHHNYVKGDIAVTAIERVYDRLVPATFEMKLHRHL